MNPYYTLDFFQFIALFFNRVLHGFPEGLYSDEIQIGVLLGVALSSSLVGTFLVVRKITMLANSLSHTILLGIVLAYYFGSTKEELYLGSINLTHLLIAAFVVGLITALTTEFLTRFAKLQEDASTGIVFTTFFAIGIILVNLLSRNAHIGAEVVMGNVDALSFEDLKLVYIVLLINLFFFFLFFKEWQITSFDPILAKLQGISPTFFAILLMCLVSLTVVGAFRAVGVLMVLTFLTAPPLTLRLFSSSLKTIALGSLALSGFLTIVSVALSRHILSVYDLPLSTGGIVATLLGSIFFVSLAVKNLTKKVSC